MALTATATIRTRKVIMKSLEMRCCHVLARNPNKINIRYAVQLKPSDPLSIFCPFISSLISCKMADRCICFCRSYDDTNKIYELVSLELVQNNALFPASTHPDVSLYGSKIRTCEKLDSCTSKNLKAKITESFTKPNGAV